MLETGETGAVSMAKRQEAVLLDHLFAGIEELEPREELVIPDEARRQSGALTMCTKQRRPHAERRVA